VCVEWSDLQEVGSVIAVLVADARFGTVMYGDGPDSTSLMKNTPGALTRIHSPFPYLPRVLGRGHLEGAAGGSV